MDSYDTLVIKLFKLIHFDSWRAKEKHIYRDLFLLKISFIGWSLHRKKSWWKENNANQMWSVNIFENTKRCSFKRNSVKTSCMHVRCEHQRKSTVRTISDTANRMYYVQLYEICTWSTYITKIMRGKFTSIVLDSTYFVSTKYGQPKYTNIYYQIGFIYLLIHSIEELKTNPKPTWEKSWLEKNIHNL